MGSGYDRSAWTSGTLGPPSGKTILLKLALERLVRPTHPDALDAHFVVADVGFISALVFTAVLNFYAIILFINSIYTLN